MLNRISTGLVSLMCSGMSPASESREVWVVTMNNTKEYYLGVMNVNVLDKAKNAVCKIVTAPNGRKTAVLIMPGVDHTDPHARLLTSEEQQRLSQAPGCKEYIKIKSPQK